MVCTWDEWKQGLEVRGYGPRGRGAPSNEVQKNFSVKGIDVLMIVGKKPNGKFYGKLLLSKETSAGKKVYPISCANDDIFDTNGKAADYIENELKTLSSLLLEGISKATNGTARTA